MQASLRVIERRVIMAERSASSRADHVDSKIQDLDNRVADLEAVRGRISGMVANIRMVVLILPPVVGLAALWETGPDGLEAAAKSVAVILGALR